MFIVKFIKLVDEAKVPEKYNTRDAAYDIFSIDKYVIKSGKHCLIRTGICIELPKNTEAQIRPRSGLALKYGITVLNSPGTIDESYRGELGVILINHSESDFYVTKHMRIAQLLIMPVYQTSFIEVNELSESIRGDKGFGSSGISGIWGENNG